MKTNLINLETRSTVPVPPDVLSVLRDVLNGGFHSTSTGYYHLDPDVTIQVRKTLEKYAPKSV